jgi:hypothetical protein
MPTSNLIAATSAVPQVLVSSLLTVSEATYFAVSSNNSVKVGTASLCNTSSSAVVVSLSLAKTGGSAGVANRVVSSVSLAANTTLNLDQLSGAFMGPGDFISAIAATGGVVALVLTGIVFS